MLKTHDQIKVDVAGDKFGMKNSLKNFFRLINKVNEFHISM